MAVTLCPNCKKQCQSAEAVLEHLNSADTCWPENLINGSMLPVPQALQRPPGQTDLSAKYHPTSGYHYLLPDKPPPQNIFQEMQSHPLQEARETNIWYPFDGPGEWSLAKFLVENLSQTQIDKFLKEQPQFKSKDELFFYMQWPWAQMAIGGYEAAFANPVYASHMCYNPHYIYQGQEHQFGEFWTSDDAWEIQNQLPEGATIILIIAASDKTPVTKHMGGLEMHPLFLTIGNIQGDVCMKATSHAWRCTAFMPIPTFIINSDFQTLLWSCLWHKCMDLVCSNLKVAACIGEYMIDPSARLCREAKKLCLSRVHLPYWRNWRHSNPARFLTPEILHALHKFFLIIHHKHTGVHHFSGGVSHVNQMTGQEHRDIQRTIVPTLWGMASPGFIHAGKSGAKDDFFIPKLELMQSFARAISHVGTLMQWMADICQRDFILQIAHILNQEETIRLFDLYTLLSSSSYTPGQDPLINTVVMEDEEVTSTETDPAFAWVSNTNQATQLRQQAPRPIHNHFLKGILSDNARIAFNVTVKADRSCLNMSQLQSLYNISDFYHALHLYATRNGCILPGQLLFNTWMKFRIQLHSTFHACRIMPSQQIHAEPPSSNFPRGNCDVVLFNQWVDGGNDGSHVAQVRTIFQPTLPKGSCAQPLVYIQLFDFVMPGPEPSTGMWMVRQSYTRHPSQSERVIRRGCIIPLTDVTHAVEIIPVY
ncbi:hypothetical protein BDR03DRAFT_935935 [Suillus americanus]|nr:hypothetical protein BDR03DRAFT_935935 [Suillus americanus]